jgi:hypothetical protein
MATANVTISDPATCQAPGGPFSHVYVTITDVSASTNANAAVNDSSFVDLTPGLSSQPKQVDLLGQANNQCFLATLGSTTELQAGSYQQIRIKLAPDSAAASVSNNACGGFANCVVLADGSVHDLALSSEATTGIKIPSGQIASGAFTIAEGQTKDLDIDFLTCESIVQEGNGSYRLKPVLHAGEVATTSTSINGTVSAAQGSPSLAGADVIVALEQKDASGVDRIVMTTKANASGGFVLCPVPAGTYDLVITAVSSSGIAYAPAVLTGIQPGETAGTIPLTTTSGALAVINGEVTTANSSNSGTAADITISALQSAGSNGPVVTIPLFSSQGQTGATYNVTTANASTCPSGTACASYTLNVPAAYPMIGSYSASGATFTSTGSGAVTYTVDGLAFVSGSGGTADCSPSEQKTTQTVTIGASATASTLAFSGCQ